MTMRWATLLVASLAFALAAPAAACTITPTPRVCAPDGACEGPVFEQFQRQRAQRVAIDHGRAVAEALDARRDAAGFRPASDIARLVFPLVVEPVNWAVDGCGPPVEDAAGDELVRAGLLVDFQQQMLAQAGLTSSATVQLSDYRVLAATRQACQDEATGAFADYIAASLPPAQLAAIWGFLAPRAGPVPSADARQRLAGWRFTFLSAGQLAYNQVQAPPHIDGRRERAWQYLQRHDNGRAIMSAANQFIQSRSADGRGEAVMCPMAHAETQRLIAELAARR